MISGISGKRHTLFLGLLMGIVAMAQLNDVWAQEPGEQLFQASCVVCHSIGDGTRIGPDLAGVPEKRSLAMAERIPCIRPQAGVTAGQSACLSASDSCL